MSHHLDNDQKVQQYLMDLLEIDMPYTKLLVAIEGDKKHYFEVGGMERRLMEFSDEERAYIAEKVENHLITGLERDFDRAPNKHVRRAQMRKKGEIFHEAFLRGETLRRNVLRDTEGLEEDRGRVAAITGLSHFAILAHIVRMEKGDEMTPLLKEYSQATAAAIEENQLAIVEDPGTNMILLCDLLDKYLPLGPAPRSQNKPKPGGF